MKIEPFTNKEGYRVWLSENEQDMILNYYEEEPRKKLALQLMLHGLRSDEVIRVTIDDFRKMDTDEDGWMLQVREGKTGFRECPVSTELVSDARMIKNLKDLKKEDALVDVSKRTVQRYVSRAADDLRQDDSDWKYVTAHDLRRTWATHTYWRLSGSRAKDVLMSWGGWTDVQTFSENYLGAIPDSVAIDVMQEAKIN